MIFVECAFFPIELFNEIARKRAMKSGKKHFDLQLKI